MRHNHHATEKRSTGIPRQHFDLEACSIGSHESMRQWPLILARTQRDFRKALTQLEHQLATEPFHLPIQSILTCLLANYVVFCAWMIDSLYIILLLRGIGYIYLSYLQPLTHKNIWARYVTYKHGLRQIKKPLARTFIYICPFRFTLPKLWYSQSPARLLPFGNI